MAPHTVRLTNLHVALRPYIDRCIADAQRGIPALRPDFYEAMDYAASHDMYSYFLGSDLFVCPVIERRAKRRQVHLPAGDWIHLWTGIPYAGDRSYTVDAPLGQLPVFYRQDSEFANLFRTVADNK